MAIFAAAYHLRVVDRNTRKHESLDSIAGNKDLLSFIKQALEECKHKHHDDQTAERFSLAQKIDVEGRIIEGRLLVGDYGQECPVYDAETGQVAFKKGEKHADGLPFFFRVEVPENRDEALLLIEKSKKTAPKTAFVSMLQTRFKVEFHEYTLKIEPVMPTEVFSEYLEKGKVRKLSFIRMGLPTDMANLLDKGHEELFGKTELVITASRNRYLPIKKSIFKSSSPTKAIQDLYELKDIEYENVKVEVAVGRHRRSIDLGRKRASPLYELTKDVKLRGGVPTYESIRKAFASLAADIKEGTYARL